VKEAVRQMHQALEIRPEDPGLQLILAQALVLDKDYEAAAALMPQYVHPHCLRHDLHLI
jgi:thioredoxin-like negative regulator of GroEL